MLSPADSHAALAVLFGSQPVVDLARLCATLGTTSRMSVFRRLSAMGYLSSYSHTGRFYTLRTIPRFDHDGLWWYQGVGFSRHGALRATVAHLVEQAATGATHQELQGRLRVRVHNAVLALVHAHRIGCASLAGQHPYVSADPGRFACAKPSASAAPDAATSGRG